MPTYVQWDDEGGGLEDIPEDQPIPRRRRRDVEPFNETTGLKGSGSRRRNVQPLRPNFSRRGRAKENGWTEWQ